MQVRFPVESRYVLRNARIAASLLDAALLPVPDPDGFIRGDILIDAGRIGEIATRIVADVPDIDLDGGQVWPASVELHTHLDKGHIAPRARNPDGTVPGAAEAVRQDRTANLSAEDVARRFDFSLRCAYAHGTAAIRTHIDSYHPQAPISWPVFTRMRDEWAGRIELQAVGLTTLDVYEGDAGRELADLIAAAGGVLGGVTRFAGPFVTPERGPPDPGRIAAALDQLLRIAAERGLDVDLHVDETADLEPNTLKQVAQAVLRNRFQGRVVCGHCCSLALRTDAAARETIALVREAGVCIVSLPMVNLHLQGRIPSGTPRWRGVTLIRELDAAGVPVAVSSDNCRDPFYSFGDLDAVEVFREAVRIGHLDLDAARWLPLVSRAPAGIMRLPHHGRLAPGAKADLMLFRARTLSELLSRPQSDRLVVRGGRPSQAVPPDYRELDEAVGS